MKIEAKQVRFLPMLPWFGRRRIRFVGKANTIQLLETALVIEGQRKMLALYVIDLFFQQALSEWTMVTVPYSLIESCRYSRRWVVRGLFATLFIMPVVVFLVLSVLWVGQTPGDAMSLMTPVLLFGLLLLSLYALLRIFPSQYVLRFRRADGRLVRTHFRIKSRAVRRAFEQRLETNRTAAGTSSMATPTQMADTVAPMARTT
jgi:hypothetical protein